MTENRAAYLADILSPDRLTRIVDVGANPVAAPPYAALADQKLCEVWGFEPQKEPYEALIAEERAREHYLPYAIGKGTEERLHICIGSGFTSLYEPNPEFIATTGRWPRAMRVKEVVPITTHRLDDIGEIPEFDLLKIDVQGAELDVFENARQKLTSTTAVITEVAMVPLYKDQPLFDAQMRELSSQGFFFHKFLFLKKLPTKSTTLPHLRTRRAASQSVDGDAVFVRGLFSLTEMTDERLKHLAILADAVFGSLDLTLTILDLLSDRGVIGQSEIDGYLERMPPELRA